MTRFKYDYLIITEKPSVARAIGEALFNFKGKGDIEGIYSGKSIIIKPCMGHLIELSKPEAYNKKYLNWSLNHLPIIPTTWLFNTKEGISKNIQSIEYLLKNNLVDTIIHAGDPDREGQLIVDELLDHLNKKNKNKFQRYITNAQRIKITSLSNDDIYEALIKMKPNKDEELVYQIGNLRLQLDWLIGYNLTRYYSLDYKKNINNDIPIIRIGRVQTPTLNILYDRYFAKKNFKPETFYRYFLEVDNLQFEISIPQTVKYRLGLNTVPKENHYELLGVDNRLDDLINVVNQDRKIKSFEFITNLQTEFNNNNLIEIVSSKVTLNDIEYPKGFSLSSLQTEAFTYFNIPIKRTLEIVQKLYEEGYVTYPRTDCDYYHDNDTKYYLNLRAQLEHNYKLFPFITKVELQDYSESPSFNSNKIINHSSIAPTQKLKTDFDKEDIKCVYELIIKQYLKQFVKKPKKGIATIIIKYHVGALSYFFYINDEMITEIGYLALDTHKKIEIGQINDFNKYSEFINKSHINGNKFYPTKDYVKEGKTTESSHYTQASLLNAMKNCSKFVSDPILKKTLYNVEGIGTEATRADIINKLLNDGYAEENKKKELIITKVGIKIIEYLKSKNSILLDIGFTGEMEKAFSETNISTVKELREQYINIIKQICNE